MRTLSRISRIFAATAAVMAAALIIGGSYYVGFVGEVQRGLNDPQSANRQASAKIAHMEQTLGYQGYLRAYRSYRLTGDVSAREQMTQRAMDAARTLDGLRALLSRSPNASLAIEDIASVVEEFARIARSAPETPAAALRGSASMDAIEAMPQTPQLEATYLTLRTALERLRIQTSAHQMGSIAWALTWSQMLIICAFATLVLGLIAAAGLLQIGITQPLKSLTWSLRAISSGRVNQPVWGTDRTDEIGEIARAGEKIRQSLTEVEALRELAQEGQINIRLEGEASALLSETISEVIASVNDATDALRRAADGVQETQAAQQQASAQQSGDINAVTSKLDTLVTGLDQAHQHLAQATETRLAHLDTVAGQLGERGARIDEAFDAIKSRTGHAIDGLTTSISAFGNAASSVQSIQGAFFESCDRISADAATTAQSLRSLADQLSGVVAEVGTHLQAQAGTTPSPVTRTEEIDQIVRLFTDNQRTEGRADNNDLIERIAALLANHLAPNQALMQQIQAMRGDIHELALRMTEERILMTAEMPAAALAAETTLLPTATHKTLADVPAEEILARLRQLSDEMAHAPAEQVDEQPGLTDALKAFALRMKPMATTQNPQENLRTLAPELAEHARTIEQGAREVDHAAALRTELDAITAELRSLAEAAHAATDGTSQDLRDTAVYLGARAESLFSYLSQRQAEGTGQPGATSPVAIPAPATPASDLHTATEDLSTLARIITSLERRTAELSDEAVAANILLQTEGQADAGIGLDTNPVVDPDEAITVVYEAVERLNNIAAALARAGEANRMRASA